MCALALALTVVALILAPPPPVPMLSLLLPILVAALCRHHVTMSRAFVTRIPSLYWGIRIRGHESGVLASRKCMGHPPRWAGARVIRIPPTLMGTCSALLQLSRDQLARFVL